MPQNESGMLDLSCDGEVVASLDLAEKDTFAFENLPDGEKLIELWLPQFGRFQLRSLEIDDGATLESFTDTRPRWVTYGSSITQCRTAASPTQTWPAIVARDTRVEFDLSRLWRTVPSRCNGRANDPGSAS